MAMRLLVLGGTSFLGRHVVEGAIASGATVTLFNRGLTNPTPFDGIEHLRGDRAQDLSALDGRTWDAVVDTCGFVPAVVRASAERLAGAAAHYTFVSSISVYADLTAPGCDETWPASPPDFESMENTGETYGPLKRACEVEVERTFGDRALIARPGFIVGPYDPVPRLAYWLRRAARGGHAAAPGAPERPVQLVDARDLARWMLDQAGARATGTYNLTAPPGLLTMAAMLDTCRSVTGGDVRYTWVDDDRLGAAGVRPVDGLPYWLPEAAPGVMRVSVERAVARGLETRPFEDTARDTWAWLRTQPPSDPPHVRASGSVRIASGISADDEARLLPAP